MTKKIQVTSGIVRGMLRQHVVRYNYMYLIQRYRKHSGLHNKSDQRAMQDGKVKCNTAQYTTALYYLIGCIFYDMVQILKLFGMLS